MTRESSPASPIRLRDRAATEAAIVAAAQRLLLAEGWTGLNVQTLAAGAGVDRKLIYRYFDGVDGVLERVAAGLDHALGQTLAAEPATAASSYRQFAQLTLTAWLRALRANPLILRLMVWEASQDTPLLRRTEAARTAVLQAWARQRRPLLKTPPAGDLAALNTVLMAAVQGLAVASAARGGFGGVALDDAGWLRIETAIATLTAVWPD